MNVHRQHFFRRLFAAIVIIDSGGKCRAGDRYEQTDHWPFPFVAWRSGVEAQTPFYQRKTIKHVVGSPAGSNYDMYGRLTVAYLGKYIAGNPEVVVQNMVGAGSMVAANYLYRVAAPDGLIISSIR